MAIFGTLETLRWQLARPDHFAAAFDYLSEALRAGGAVRERIGLIAPGSTERVELDGGSFALEQAYMTKPRTEGRWESHRAYIDLQLIVVGEELMEVTEAGWLDVAEDLTPEKDIIFYQPFVRGSVLRVRAGEAAAFFPPDAHMPSLSTGSTPALVRKSVVKVPVWR